MLPWARVTHPTLFAWRRTPRPPDWQVLGDEVGLVLRSAKAVGRVRASLGCTRRSLMPPASPNPAGVLAHHRLSRLTRKCLLELRRVLQRAVHAVAAGRVRVRHGAGADFLGRRVFAPDLGESQEEALLGGEAIQLLRLALERVLKRHESDAQTAVIGGVFAQRQAAVQLDVVDRGEAGIFVGDAGGALVELGAVGRGPPVAQIAVAIELAALVVEPVSHLVADHRSGSAVVERDVAAGVEERGLEDACREVDAVVLRAVEAVDSG